MHVDGLLIPNLLLEMLDDGRWPRTAIEASKQNLHSFVPEDRNRRLRSIFLFAPPFQTVARAVASGGKDFYSQFGALHELVPEAAIAIGDYGLGADTPILLDYQNDPANPRVIQLEWPGDNGPNYWVVIAPDFASFVQELGL
ncbi:hypothetical protein FRUB_03089 [Fimbriiglobus ruber]|uniref:Knr4/Smi1-like domain-containing protein n=2 Tax=Fimbriiglobus ruber TaxID=1908690 RepID=A0A225DPX6_9BACT|nr:hypothetical protein FRUB_03089 [Fimbriiglobus ruber]